MAEAPRGFDGLERPRDASWWKADDGKWYPPDTRPGFRKPAPPRVQPGSGSSAAGAVLGLLAAVAGLFAFGIAFVTPALALPAGAVSVLLGVAAHVVARRRNARPQWANVGISLGVIGVIVGLSIGSILDWSDREAKKPSSAAHEQECVIERFMLEQVSNRFRAQYGRRSTGLPELRAFSPLLARQDIRWHMVTTTGSVVIRPGSGCTT
ncbi:MAG: hypothetical protein ACXVKA_08000 [Acidimicrobiia bacterium]